MNAKDKNWELLSKEKLGKNSTSTFKMQAGGGHIYLIMIQTPEGVKTETVFAPDTSVLANGFAKIAIDVKREMQEIEARGYHEGEYSTDIIPMDRRVKETEIDSLKRNKRKKKEIFPDHLPENFLI